jgi:hypothetical protein
MGFFQTGLLKPAVGKETANGTGGSCETASNPAEAMSFSIHKPISYEPARPLAALRELQGGFVKARPITPTLPKGCFL